MKNIRKITMTWNDRNIDRLTKWFKIEYDFKGYFTSSIGNGYKLANKDWSKITFCFTK